MSSTTKLTPTATFTLLAAHAQGLRNQAIADLLGVSLASLKRYKTELSLGSTDPRNNLGKLGEQLVAEALRQVGLSAQVMAEGHEFDLQSGSLRLEVKTSETSQEGRYRFRLNENRGSNHARYRYHKDYQADSDFLLLAVVYGGELQHLYCIPTTLWEPSLWVHPASPFCPYAPYRNALYLLQTALAA